MSMNVKFNIFWLKEAFLKTLSFAMLECFVYYKNEQKIDEFLLAEKRLLETYYIY